MPALSQGASAQVFTPMSQQVIELSAGAPTAIAVPPERMIRYTSSEPVKVTIGSVFDATACFEASDNLFGLKPGVEAITLRAEADATVYLEIG